MMMKSKLVFLSIVLGVSLFTTADKSLAAPVICNFPTEKPSNRLKTVSFNQLGFSMQIPVNYRTVVNRDGAIQILDNGTYQLIQCLRKNPQSPGGVGYYSLNLSKAPNNSISKNVIRKAPGNPNIFIIGNQDITGYRRSLKIRTKKGVIDFHAGDEGSSASVEELITWSRRIKIHK